jgi:tetratricopeptide (TPR) repeat protein
MTFWPAGLCAMYPHPGHWPTATVIGAAFVLVVITIVCVWRRRTMPFMAVGWFWFLGMLVPVIGIVQVGRQALADRYTYLPSIGILVAVVWGVTRLTEKWRNREMFARASVFAAGLACIVLTVRQIGYWKDSKILFTRAMDVTERNWIASAYLAGELQDRGELDAAIGMCHYSLQMNPYRGDVHCKLGELYMQKHQLQDARIEFEQAVAMDPEDFESHHGLAASLQDMGRLEEAIEQFKQALRIKPSYADAYSDLGNCYGMQGKIEDSLRCFQEAVKLKPRSADNHHDFGIGLAHAQRWDEAISQFQQAVQLDPSNERMRRDLQAAIDSKARMPPGPQIDADGRK